MQRRRRRRGLADTMSARDDLFDDLSPSGVSGTTLGRFMRVKRARNVFEPSARSEYSKKARPVSPASSAKTPPKSQPKPPPKPPPKPVPKPPAFRCLARHPGIEKRVNQPTWRVALPKEEYGSDQFATFSSKMAAINFWSTFARPAKKPKKAVAPRPAPPPPAPPPPAPPPQPVMQMPPTPPTPPTPPSTPPPMHSEDFALCMEELPSLGEFDICYTTTELIDALANTADTADTAEILADPLACTDETIKDLNDGFHLGGRVVFRRVLATRIVNDPSAWRTKKRSLTFKDWDRYPMKLIPLLPPIPRRPRGRRAVAGLA